MHQSFMESVARIAKGGEGSRGGNVVSHTKSGKPVYMSASKMSNVVAADHANFDPDDHAEASEFHEMKAREAGARGDKETQDKHKDQATAHWRLENRKTKRPPEKPPSRTFGGVLRGEFARSQETTDMTKSGNNSKPAHTTDWAALPDEFMADVAKCYDGMKKSKKSADMPGDGDDDEIDLKVQDAGGASVEKNHHGPTGGGGLFGGSAGAGLGQGMAAGQAIGSEAASGTPEAPRAAIHTAVGRVAAAGTPRPQQQQSKPAKPPSSQGGGAGAGMGIGATSKSCEKCDAGDCPEHMEKALTSRSLVVPFYMRQPAYDSEGTMRSATAQTSRMYSSIAPDVDHTLQHIAAESEVRSRQAVADLKRSQEIAEMRERLHVSVRPRGDKRFGG
jgi:hypothetical protein